ncbi:DUF397 domain-containing protein [Actinomadura fibrosa]|uniref:DUF397 domain-containing protein n=1 Tax=Actinomadura fibrosa TaxID=111802 RepID=A0ABW2Y0F3_9ACTN|nr:DUF397 domain-containing protein [Actinomadura fibrosa]
MDLSEGAWRRASRSHDDGDQCVEVASFSDVVAFRDSKDPDGPRIVVSRGEFGRFAEALRDV